jgi:hypothetical protein
MHLSAAHRLLLLLLALALDVLQACQLLLQCCQLCRVCGSPANGRHAIPL